MTKSMTLEDVQVVEHTENNPLFRLGMPHMSASGIRHSWLLGEACHRHWASIASQVGVNPSEFRDKKSARVLASVVACTINGDAQCFNEDNLCELIATERPTATNGWRSQLDLISEGKSMRAEIITSFAKRDGVSNTQLVAAELEDTLQVQRDHEEARRTQLIRTLGSQDRKSAVQNEQPPHMSFEICRDMHINGVGLVYFANIYSMFEKVERNAIPKLIGAYPMHNRRVHFFGNLDIGDTLEFTSHASAQSLSPTPSVVVRSHAKRSSDGTVIACAESIYG